MLKKILKIIIILLIILVLIWAIVFAINVIRCFNHKSPILCFTYIEDEFTKDYKFVGYTITINKQHKKNPTVNLTFFNSSKEIPAIQKIQSISNTSTMDVREKENSSQNITRSTSSYNPENTDKSNTNNNGTSFNSEVLNNRTLEKVKVEVVEESVTRTGATVIIIDNNDVNFSWNKEVYKIEQKQDNNWSEVTPNKNGFDITIGYNRDENNQFKFELNWKQDYGSLQNGIYRIVEIPTDATGIIAYSNEFEI